MKIGIITFQWADNYGAVLQSFALSKYLNKNGYSAEDINYIPLNIYIRKKLKNIIYFRLKKLILAHKFKMFRANFLSLSKKIYYSNRDLFSGTEIYDALICGSDQIWNESFCMTAEKQPTLSYFLNFAKPNQRRISYAASFGTNRLSPNIIKYALPELRKFDYVSVRESNAVLMLNEYGIDASLICDPTFLLEIEDYDEIVSAYQGNNKVQLFNYMLRRGRESTDKTDLYIKTKLFPSKTNLGECLISPVEWLYHIKNCDYVVTDSFHGTVFAILFHKPFVSINDIDCNMNARIKTLLEKVELVDHMLEFYDEGKINEIISKHIDWSLVDERRRAWKIDAEHFIKKALNK